MKPNKETVYDFIKLHSEEEHKGGVSTQYIAQVLNMQRTNVSTILNSLVDEGRIDKSNGRPVLYHINENQEEEKDNCFNNMIGSHGSLKRAVQLAKAAVLYPQKSLNCFICGAKGTGKKYLAKLMYQFALSNGVIARESKFVVFDCREYIENETQAIVELAGTQETSGQRENSRQQIYLSQRETSGQQDNRDQQPYRGLLKTTKGVLYIDNAQCLSPKVLSALHQTEEQGPMLIVGCDSKSAVICENYAAEFPIMIELPVLAERPLNERMEMIQSFFTLEAARIKRTLVIKEELLRCLLLYDCDANCMQLKGDIKIGCANAYVREYKNKEQIQLYISDFEHYVRKGFLKYQTYREEIEQLIPSNYSYSFSEKSVSMSAVDQEKLKNGSIYDEINKKASELDASGLEENEINLILSTEVENLYRSYQNSLTKEVENKEQLAILVDKRIIPIVEQFLKEACVKLGRSFKNSVFYSLCLHINSVITKQSNVKKLAPKQVSNILKNYEAEYLLSMELTVKLKEIFEVEIPIEDIIMITMFISLETPITEISNKPVILLAFYGDDVAASIMKTIVSLTQLDNVFSFELTFEKDTEEIYDSLKQYISKINRGKGMIVIYDSSFLSDMLTSIEEELNIMIRQMPMPITSIGIELARKAALNDNVDSVYQEIMSTFDCLNGKLKKIIIALCTTGKGSAEELKRYIESYGNPEDMKVVSMAISDEATIKEEFLNVMKTGSIQCVVGTYDPKLFSIPFISISEIFGTPKEQLPALIRLNKAVKKKIDYEGMIRYLGEQLEHTNIDKLEKLLPAVLSDINDKICELSVDTHVGLFIHISCCIDRLLGGYKTPANVRKEIILSKFNGQFRKLLKAVKPLEKAFDIIINDDEIANILTIIYKL